ncbi:MAG: hypothetical protein DRQ48_09465 [Gammaproteobacteria bacterium]|nr:MAG: hypothetical protein DRQ48_09465 [Gammaproteobacteria bacterium]
MLQEEYETYVDLFKTEGWKLFQESIVGAEEQLKNSSVDSAVTNDQWQFLRGQLTQLRNVAAFETFIKLTFEQSEKDEEDDGE